MSVHVCSQRQRVRGVKTSARAVLRYAAPTRHVRTEASISKRTAESFSCSQWFTQAERKERPPMQQSVTSAGSHRQHTEMAREGAPRSVSLLLSFHFRASCSLKRAQKMAGNEEILDSKQAAKEKPKRMMFCDTIAGTQTTRNAGINSKRPLNEDNNKTRNGSDHRK